MVVVVRPVDPKKEREGNERKILHNRPTMEVRIIAIAKVMMKMEYLAERKVVVFPNSHMPLFLLISLG